jgi:imidazole glycerol-phosphate synthase subunit HisH
MNTIVVVDYGMCNLDSVARAVEECGGTAVVSDRVADLERASRIILPGVGAFPDAMRHLKQLGLDKALYEQAVEKGIPFLGICLGMQLLADVGWENNSRTEGLRMISGEVRRLDPIDEGERIPHVGWNEVHATRTNPLFRGIAPGRDFYFAHSYHFSPSNPADVLATTPFAGSIISAVQNGLIFGVQFHPEKSQKAGFQLLSNFFAV